MDDIQRQLDKARKNDLARQRLGAERGTKILTEGGKRGQEIIKKGQDRGRGMLETGEKRSKEILGPGSTTGTGGNIINREPIKWKSADELIKENEELFQKELYKQKLFDRRAQSGGTVEGEKAGIDKESGSEAGVKGSWNRLQARLDTARKLKLALASETGAFALIGADMLSQSAQQAVKNVWYAIHEFFEEIAFATFFLASPLCVLVLLIRIIGYFALNPFLSIKFRGQEVKLFAGPGWGDISRIKTVLAIIITFIMIFIIYLATHPVQTIINTFGFAVWKIFKVIIGVGA